MATSDQELEELSQRVARKREQVAAAQAQRETRERELSNDITATQLQAEEVRLDAALAAAKNAAKVSAVKEGASAPLEAAREEMVRAVAAQEGQTALAEADAAAAQAAKDAEKDNDTSTKER